VTGAASGIGRAIAERLVGEWLQRAGGRPPPRWRVVSFLLGPDGRAFTGAPVTMDLGWTAR
jgi:hypothetical protein